MLPLRKQKGQSLTEFALILPLLLLLLLGIIEASRVIWAYITVQTAAREAVRYAVTGRPYVDTNKPIQPAGGNLNQQPICSGQNPEPSSQGNSSVQPWLCVPEDRFQAVQNVAKRRGQTLNVPDTSFCLDQASYQGPCSQKPGAFGILIRGQVVTDTLVNGTTTTTYTVLADNPGTPGLVVQVNTFYNIKMITPIFDFLMGKQYITLRGSAQLQNEGLDETLGIEPPPAVGPAPPPGVSDPDAPPVSNARIWLVTGYQVSQSEPVIAHLENHPTGLYDVFLRAVNGTLYRICGGADSISTDVQNRGEDECSLVEATIVPSGQGANVPVGTYRLFSTLAGTSDPIVAEADEQLVVVPSDNPILTVEGGVIWAANSTTYLHLLFHDTSKAPYKIELRDGNNALVGLVTSNASGLSSEDIPWLVADLENLGKAPCDLQGSDYCVLRSIGNDGTVAAETPVRINQPYIIMAPPPTQPYRRGQSVYITLGSHTPGQSYHIKGKRGPDPLQQIGTSTDVNSVGDSSPIIWYIDEACGGPVNFQDGVYTISSRQIDVVPDAIIAQVNDVYIETPADPYLTIEGGTVWPAGSQIRISVHKHTANAVHYLEFNNTRIPIDGGDNTFTTNGCGTRGQIPFDIPIITPAGLYTISSFLVTGTTFVSQAQQTIEVLGVPTIQVVEGPSVSPDSEITIKLANHVPGHTYQIDYADKNLFTVLTDVTGQATRQYDLKELPPPAVSTSEPHFMRSRSLSNLSRVVATTTLTLNGANLIVEKVEVPNNMQVDSTALVTITMRNTATVPINRWFDLDMYFNPAPIAPSYIQGYNYPGTIKFWRESVGPNETFIVTTTVPITRSGLHNLYGFVDTTNFVYEGETTGQAGNPDNLRQKTFSVNCGSAFVDQFSADFDQGATMPGWRVKTYGNGDAAGFRTQATGDKLLLDSTGQSTFTPDDDSSGAGQLLFYRTGSIDSSNGLEVEAQILNVEKIATNSKAGIEIRSDVNDPTSARVMYEVVYSNDTNSQTLARAWFRPENGGMIAVDAGQDVVLNNSSNPLWLRIRREPGIAGTFKFYFHQGSGTPPPVNADPITKQAWWGEPKATVQALNGMNTETSVYIGLFNASYSATTAGTSEFEQFRAFPDNSSCNEPEPSPAPTFPPGLTICPELLEDRSFEDAVPGGLWLYPLDVGVTRSDDGENSGNFSLRAVNRDNAGFYAPIFSQRVSVPVWIISTTTTLDFSFYKSIRTLMTNIDDQHADKFYAVITTESTPNTGIRLTEITEIVNGTSSAGQGELESDPTPLIVRLPVASGINLENYKGVQAYLHLYNLNREGACPNNTSDPLKHRCATQFFFDDVSLFACTTQPKPDPITTRITGRVTVQSTTGGGVQTVQRVKVWAYAPDGQVYETTTIQGGEYNFYNLPASTPGIEYTIFTQYVRVNPNAPSQIETLADTRSVLLRSTNTDSNPVRMPLALLTLPDLD